MLGSALDLVMAAGHPFYDNDHQKVDTPDYSFMYEEDYAKLSAGETDWNYFESNDDFKKWRKATSSRTRSTGVSHR